MLHTGCTAITPPPSTLRCWIFSHEISAARFATFALGIERVHCETSAPAMSELAHSRRFGFVRFRRHCGNEFLRQGRDVPIPAIAPFEVASRGAPRGVRGDLKRGL